MIPGPRKCAVHGLVRCESPGCQPSRGGRRGPGQEVAGRISLARDLIMKHIDDVPSPTWKQTRDRLMARRSDLTQAQCTDAVNRGELELEYEDAIVFDAEGFHRPRPDDPPRCDPAVVAEQLKALTWPNPETPKGTRSLWEMTQELGFRDRHCDLHAAIHDVLKPAGLLRSTATARWAWQGEPTVTEHYDEEEELGALTPAERQTEQQLVEDYLAWLGRALKPHRFVNGRVADLLDGDRSLLIEAKADADDRTAAHGMGQVCYYRSLSSGSGQVAVLLPCEPAEDVRRFLRNYEVGLIYRDGVTFKEELS